jgi:hypothetical protein
MAGRRGVARRRDRGADGDASEFRPEEDKEVHEGTDAQPAERLPRRELGSLPIVETLDAHLITGSKRESGTNGEAKDFVDG